MMNAERDLFDKLSVQHPETFTVDDLRKMLEECLPDVLPNLAYPGREPIEALPMLDYMLSGYEYRNITIADLLDGKDYLWAEAVPETGGSEGVYLSIRLVSHDFTSAPKKWPVITAKTLQEGPMAYALMGLIGGAVTYLIEWFLNINY